MQIKKKLHHYTLDVCIDFQNEITVLLGPSGSGKTTILDCIAGLKSPDKGSISLGGFPHFTARKSQLSPRQRNVGYVFQDYALFPHMTVDRNIRYAISKDDHENNVDELVRFLGIKHLLGHFPHEISGGEQQRVALARALAAKPAALLLDEPLSALDDDTRMKCQEKLLRIRDLWNIPFIIVTHSKQEAEKLAHRVITLHQGKVVRDTYKGSDPQSSNALTY